jgi:hypothetical protein
LLEMSQVDHVPDVALLMSAFSVYECRRQQTPVIDWLNCTSVGYSTQRLRVGDGQLSLALSTQIS